jgi:hypothetical protein
MQKTVEELLYNENEFMKMFEEFVSQNFDRYLEETKHTSITSSTNEDAFYRIHN